MRKKDNQKVDFDSSKEASRRTECIAKNLVSSEASSKEVGAISNESGASSKESGARNQEPVVMRQQTADRSCWRNCLTMLTCHVRCETHIAAIFLKIKKMCLTRFTTLQ